MRFVSRSWEVHSVIPQDKTPDSIVVVDDDPSIRRVLARLLRLSGFSVATYASGEQFLGEIPNSVPPHCVVLDVHLQRRSGPEIKSALHLTGMHIPVIFMTADSEAQRRIALSPCLLKPFSGNQLIHLIQEAIRPAEAGSIA